MASASPSSTRSSTETDRRGGARQEALPPDLLAGARHFAARRSRRRAQPPRDDRHLHPRCGNLRQGRRRSAPSGCTSWPAPRPICSPGSRSAGAAIRRSRPTACPSRRCSSSRAGLADHLNEQLEGRECVTAPPFAGRQDFPDGQGRAEWAVAWPLWTEGGDESYYCNTIPTPDGGTHEAGLRAALTKGIRAFGELVGKKRAKDITADDVINGIELMLSACSSAIRISRARPRTG